MTNSGFKNLKINKIRIYFKSKKIKNVKKKTTLISS
jgi:hypothetical protein